MLPILIGDRMIDRINRKYFLLAVGAALKSKDTDVDIAVRCPVCGDSARKKSSTRLHLYHKGGTDFVNCFNSGCPAENKNVFSFLRDFYPALLTQYKREQFGNNLQQLAQDKAGDVFGRHKAAPEPKKEKEVLVQDLSPYLTNIGEVPEAVEYLLSRGLVYDATRFGTWFWGHQDLKIGSTVYKISSSIVVPLYYEGTMYGFYSRNIRDKSFCTYMHEDNAGFKIFNWFGINREAPTYIFEGIFDAIAGGLPNSIASLGAKIPQERLDQLKHPVFVLDNDRTGLENALKFCGESQVYIQPDAFPEKDMNELLIARPELDLPSLIRENLFTGLSATIRLKQKL